MISSLASVTKLSPNYANRTHEVDTITPHCFVGNVTASNGLSIQKFLTYDAVHGASCNYCIGKDGDVGCGVDEIHRSWCSNSRSNDNRAITIEVASDPFHPYAMTDAAYNKLIELCVDICKRYNKDTLIWIADKTSALAYEPKANEMKLTVHRWFANKSCPGDWLYSRLGQLATEVTKRLSGTTVSKPTTKKLYKVQIGAFSNKANAEKLLAEAKKKGFTSAFIQEV